jgi:hypothetical protein
MLHAYRCECYFGCATSNLQVACRPLIKFQRLVTLIKYFQCNNIGNKNNLGAHAYDKNKYLISLLEMSKG